MWGCYILNNKVFEPLKNNLTWPVINPNTWEESWDHWDLNKTVSSGLISQPFPFSLDLLFVDEITECYVITSTFIMYGLKVWSPDD